MTLLNFPPPTQPDVLQVKIDQAARMLGYSRTTMYELINRGEIPTVGTGRLRRIAVADLQRWQERNKE